MRKLFFLSLLAIMALANIAHASAWTTYHDSRGREIGSSNEGGGYTTYYDARGKTVGTAKEWGNNVDYYDGRGHQVGSARR